MKQDKSKKLFYYGSDQAQKDAGSFSFYTPLGTKINVNDAIDSTIAPSNVNIAIPGIAVVDYEFVPGLSKTGSSDINIAAKKLYTYVRHMNSGSRNYDSPDLMNYCYSVVSAYSFVSACERVYGIMKTYSSKNRFLAKALVNALGFDYDDIAKNLAGFRQLININIKKLGALKVPNTWAAGTRQWLLNACILKDGDIDKSQMYAFRSMTIWQYNETGTYVGSLTPILVYTLGTGTGSTLTVSDVDSIFATTVNALVASEDINIMSGDILKAYGDKVWALDEIKEDYSISPVWNKDMLQIFHNLQFVRFNPTYTTNSGNIIWQDTTTNAIMFDPAPANGPGIGYGVTVANNYKFSCNMSDGLLDSDLDEITPYDVLNMMSAKNLADFDGIITGSGSPTYLSFGTELYWGITVYSDPSDVFTVNPFNRLELTSTYLFGGVMDAGNTGIYYPALAVLSGAILTRFDWFPRVVLLGANEDAAGTKSTPARIDFGDVYNFSKFELADATRCHTAIVLSAFDVEI